MELVNSLVFEDVSGTSREIALYKGNLAHIPDEYRADLLIVSAFPGDYIPTEYSLIGALHRRGLSLGALARNKAHDLRRNCGFWLSHQLGQEFAGLNIGRVACFEPYVIGQPNEVVGELFRGIFPFLNDEHDSTLAMPLLSTGDAGWPKQLMFGPLLEAAYEWMWRGLAVSRLMVVVLPNDPALNYLNEFFETFRNERKQSSRNAVSQSGKALTSNLFLSYSVKDEDAAKAIHTALSQIDNGLTIYDFRNDMVVGKPWQTELDDAIEKCQRVVAVLSPNYFDSPNCKEELMIARLRHKRSNHNVLVPVYWKSLDEELRLWLQVINFADCRECDDDKITESIIRLAQDLVGLNSLESS